MIAIIYRLAADLSRNDAFMLLCECALRTWRAVACLADESAARIRQPTIFHERTPAAHQAMLKPSVFFLKPKS